MSGPRWREGLWPSEKTRSGKTIDYGSQVEKGTVLAQIDDSLYAADVAQAKAQLEQAKAGVLRAEADLGQLQAKLFQAERDWNRAQKLGPSDALSQSDYDAALSAYDVAKANVAVGKAAIVQAKKAVAQSEANLRRAQQNLDYCTIKSPVKGSNHRPPGEHRPDRRRQPQCAEPLSDRQRPQAHAGLGLGE